MTSRAFRSLLIATCLAAGTLVSAGAGATPINSASSINAGSLVFDGFGCTITKFGSSATPKTCSDIDVAGNEAIQGLDITSNFAARSLAFDNATLSYHVRATGGGIMAMQLGFDGDFLGLAVASVTETVRDGAGKIVGLLTVSCSLLGCDQGDPNYGWFDIPLTGTFTDLYVTKQINVTGALGRATISNVQQGFDTVPVDVPEPGSLALAGMGLLAFGAARRRGRGA